MKTKHLSKATLVVIGIIIIAFLVIVVLLFTGSCKGPEKAKQTGYLVSVETTKPHKTTVHKLSCPENVDSLVTWNYGYAMTGFNSDTLFHFSPYFKIETFNKTVYVEEKEMIHRNGKIKFKKLRK